MQKKYKIIILSLTLLASTVMSKEEDSDQLQGLSIILGKPEKELLHSCSHILIDLYERILSATATHFIQEIDTVDDALETKLFKEVGQGFYKISIELVKYSKSILFTKGLLVKKAKRVAAILGGFFFMQKTMKILSNRQKRLKEDKTVSK